MVFYFLNIKISAFKNSLNNHCMLVLDEMSITPSHVFDMSKNMYLGTATLPNNLGDKRTAIHALVFMLAGISSRWKQIIAYYYIGDSVDGTKLKPIVCNIIEKAEKIGLRVHSVTSDMGSANMALWKTFGINISRYSKIINSCIHPIDKTRSLYFFHGVAHTFKNLKAGFIRNEFFKIPKEIVHKYGLPTNEVRVSHLHKLCTAQEKLDFGLLITPKLQEKFLDLNNHFHKMKVCNATNVLSHAVGSALEFYAKDTNDPTLTITAWFIQFISKWFTIMSARTSKLALGKRNIEKFEETMKFLKEVIQVVTEIEVGKSGSRKPFQTGVIISSGFR